MDRAFDICAIFVCLAELNPIFARAYHSFIIRLTLSLEYTKCNNILLASLASYDAGCLLAVITHVEHALAWPP